MKLIIALLLPLSIWAQYSASASGSTTAAAEINSKPAWQISSGPPTALACIAGKDFAFDSVGLAFYDCTVTGTPGTWVQHQAGSTNLNTWSTKTPPTGTVIGTTDTQTLTNKTLDGVSPATMVFVDPTSSIQTQLNNKLATGGNAVTATALATLPSQCGGGTVATGIAASGNANCTSSPGTLTIASGSTALGTSLINSGACASAVTVTTAGVLTTDVISTTFNGDPTAVTGFVPSTGGMLTIIPYPTAGNVNFKVCNNTLAGITPGAVTLNWGVRR